MPWEVPVSSPNDDVLGDHDSVVNRISAAVPGISWIEEAPLFERIKDEPDHPLHALVPTLPEEARALFTRPTLLGDFDGGQFSVQLYGFDSHPIRSIRVEVRGGGNPLPLLASICIPNGWIAVDDADRQEIDLGADAAAGWQRFRRYVDHAVRSIEQSNGGQT